MYHAVKVRTFLELIITFFFTELSPVTMAIVFVCRLGGGEERLWLEHVLYVWQGFIAENPEWSPIRELHRPKRTLGS